MNSELHVDGFHSYFNAVHECLPFPWQANLARRVLESGRWPDAIDVPTGLGKTAALDVAVYALAANPITSPRRIVFLVDRRVVVDQVFERAERILEKLKNPTNPVLAKMRESLISMGGDVEEPLAIAKLRGGTGRRVISGDDMWNDRPDRPAIISSTIDQYGSRLLFRGYGDSRGMSPVYTGLMGNDCLVILDEAHISAPFAQTLDSVSGEMRRASENIPVRYQVVEMTATPSKPVNERLGIGDDDMDVPELAKRLTARKTADIVQVRGRRDLPKQVSRILDNLASDDPGVNTVGIIVNRVQSAIDIGRGLQGGGNNDRQVYTLTGRMRPLDKATMTEDVIGLVSAGQGQENNEGLSVIVATQSIEVGADFDFDALITECAPIANLKQRFGRLDRLGDRGQSRGWIIGVGMDKKDASSDPIYGPALKASWDELLEEAENGQVEVGVEAWRGKSYSDAVVVEEAPAPLLLPSYMRAWAQTNPRPLVDPPVDWFLHGMEDEGNLGEVFVVWREDISSGALDAVRPHPAEMAQVPIGAARRWLSGSGQGVEISDNSVRTETGTVRRDRFESPIIFNVWDPSDKTVLTGNTQELKPGDIIAVRTDAGGLVDGSWSPGSRNEKVEDIGDKVWTELGDKPTLTLSPELHPDLSRERTGIVIPTPSSVENDAESRDRDEIIHEWLNTVELPDAYQDWRTGRGYEVIALTDDKDGSEYRYVLVSKSRYSRHFDGSDEIQSITGKGTSLFRHCKDVGDTAAEIAQNIGLPEALQEDLRVAGNLHDIGKADPRFQLQLAGGNVVALKAHPLLAKSLPGAKRARLYPDGMRHEVGSVALANSDRSTLAGAHDEELVLHLIASHHGWGRPLVPVKDDKEDISVAVEIDGRSLTAQSNLVSSSVATDLCEIFWRLNERYGFYGLVWLESILRLADHCESAK